MIFLYLFLLLVAYQYIKILRIGVDGKGGVHWYDYVITAPLVAVVWSMVLVVLYTLLILRRIYGFKKLLSSDHIRKSPSLLG